MSTSKVASSSSEPSGVVDGGNKVNALDLEFNLLKIINEEPSPGMHCMQCNSALFSQAKDHILLQSVAML